MRRFLLGLVLCLFAFDIAADSFDFDCAGVTAAAPCCASACGVHAAPRDRMIMETPVVQPQRWSVASPVHPFSLLRDKSLLRPPCLAA